MGRKTRIGIGIALIALSVLVAFIATSTYDIEVGIPSDYGRTWNIAGHEFWIWGGQYSNTDDFFTTEHLRLDEDTSFGFSHDETELRSKWGGSRYYYMYRIGDKIFYATRGGTGTYSLSEMNKIFTEKQPRS